MSRSMEAKVVRETADAWQRGQWADVLLPKKDVLGQSQAVLEWLRARANELDEPHRCEGDLKCIHCGAWPVKS